MPTVIIENFSKGLDVRNMNETTEPGALLVADNSVVNRGGELEKYKSWKKTLTLPANTYGLKVTNNSIINVFGSDPTPSYVPQKVQYNRLQPASGANMVGVNSVDLFDGKFYVSANFDDGSTIHFYDGVEVTDWVDGRATGSFELTSGTTGTIDSITVDGVELLSGAVSFNGTLEQTAIDVTNNINANTSTPNYDAIRDGVRIIVRAVDTGTAANGRVLQGFTTDLTISIIDSPLSGGQDGTSGFTPGDFVKTINTKMYALSGSVTHFSGIDKPTNWQTGSAIGAGFINMSNHSSASQELVAIGEFLELHAIFSQNNIQIWKFDADEEINAKQQTIDNEGTLSAKSVVTFSNDVVFLGRTGIRALRSLDSSRLGGIRDIGTPIDPIIQDEILTDRNAVSQAVGIIDPLDGRYLLAIGDTIYTFSFYPDKKISAWTTSKPGFTVEWFDQYDLKVIARSGDDIYNLGGVTENKCRETLFGDNGFEYSSSNCQEYDNVQADIRLPFIDGNDPSRWKMVEAIDVACIGSWDIFICEDPFDWSKEKQIASITRSTFREGRVQINRHSTHFSLRFKSKGNCGAKLGKVLVHYDNSFQE
jgi:hypothetical protein